MDEELWSEVEGSGMWVCTFEGLLRDISCQQRGKNVRIKIAYLTFTLVVVFLEGRSETFVFKKALLSFVLRWLFWKLIKKISERNWEVEVCSSPFLLDVAKEQPHSPKMAREQGRSRLFVVGLGGCAPCHIRYVPWPWGKVYSCFSCFLPPSCSTGTV